MVTVIRPSRARCVKATVPRHERAVLTAVSCTACPLCHTEGPNAPGRFAHVLGFVILRQRFAH
jgi:hypothetical protein